MKSFKEFLAEAGGPPDRYFDPKHDGEPLYPKSPSEFWAQLQHLATWAGHMGEREGGNVFKQARHHLMQATQALTLGPKRGRDSVTQMPTKPVIPDWGADLTK